jgi:hypothetical protein
MKTIYVVLAAAFAFLSLCINAQVIPDSLKVDWSRAGYEALFRIRQ